MKIVFTNVAIFNKDGMTNTQNSHVWLLNNSRASMETHFQSRFLVNICCGDIGSQVIRLFVLEEGLTSECYVHFLDVPLHIRWELWWQ